MNKYFKYLPKDKRKKILLICDDIRVHSGVATVAKEMVLHTSQHFNWVQLAGAIKHPDKGKRFDLSENTNKETGLEDSSVFLYPVDGYGNSDLVRQIIKLEKPDAIFIITDPRYFTWLFQIENEIRKKTPIIYLNIWDDYPAPLYNKAYYESCDALLGISKQTVNINKIVLGDKAKNKVIKYIPHGLNSEMYFPIDKNSEIITELKQKLFGDKEIEFLMFFNSRNIRRKQIPDTMMAFRLFLDSLPKEKADKCAFLLHTEVVSEHGTDLEAVRELLFEENYPNSIYFSQQKLSTQDLNLLYNLSDVQILLTSNEGWGLTLTESMLAGNPIIANVTGGMQDQMRFEYDEDEGPGVKKGGWIDFDEDFPSNHLGTYKKHGEWAFPVYPTNRSMQGSPLTPYIWDDRCSAEDAAKQIRKVYDLGPKKRKERGLKGREWALSDEAGFTAIKMSNRVIEAIDELFDTWKPREKFELINTNIKNKNIQTHALIY
jgi:glycosyltransferase involved in cell wall biosynthesis